jgi:hypothetical protein
MAYRPVVGVCPPCGGGMFAGQGVVPGSVAEPVGVHRMEGSVVKVRPSKSPMTSDTLNTCGGET